MFFIVQIISEALLYVNIPQSVYPDISDRAFASGETI
jgi:hypothetical protein